jgi:TPR repeat protein
MKIKLTFLLMAVLACYGSEEIEMADAPLLDASSSAAGASSSAASAAQPSVASYSLHAEAVSSSSAAPASVSLSREQQKQAQFNQVLERLQAINAIPIEYLNQDLNMNDDESFTVETFKELAQEHFKQGTPFIIAQVTTNNAGKEVKDYYDAFQLNKYLFGVNFFPGGGKNRYTNSPLTFPANPLNQQPILAPIQYYILNHAEPLLFEYLGSDYDLHMDAVKNHKMMLDFTRGMTQKEASEFLQIYFPASIVNLIGLPQGYVDALRRFNCKSNLNYNDYLRLANLFFTDNRYVGAAYFGFTNIIDNPCVPDDIKCEVKNKKNQTLPRLQPVTKLKMGADYYYGTHGIQKNYKNALELLELGLSESHGLDKKLVANSQYILAYIYGMGKGIQINYKKAESLYGSALTSELLDKLRVIIILGNLITINFYGGFGYARSPEKAVFCIKKLNQIDHSKVNPADVANKASQLMKERKYKLAKDLLEIVLNYPKVDECLFQGAQLRLADIYAFGLGVEMDVRKSTLLKKSIITNPHKCDNADRAAAYMDLAFSYFKGSGVKPDLDLALEYYKNAVAEPKIPDLWKQNALNKIEEIEAMQGPVALEYKKRKKPASADGTDVEESDLKKPKQDEHKKRIDYDEN